MAVAPDRAAVGLACRVGRRLRARLAGLGKPGLQVHNDWACLPVAVTLGDGPRFGDSLDAAPWSTARSACIARTGRHRCRCGDEFRLAAVSLWRRHDHGFGLACRSGRGLCAGRKPARRPNPEVATSTKIGNLDRMQTETSSNRKIRDVTCARCGSTFGCNVSGGLLVRGRAVPAAVAERRLGLPVSRMPAKSGGAEFRLISLSSPHCALQTRARPITRTLL